MNDLLVLSGLCVDLLTLKIFYEMSLSRLERERERERERESDQINALATLVRSD